MNLLTLQDKSVVVVGAGTRPSSDPDPPLGNGRAIALLAAQLGAKVSCIDIDFDAADETRSMIVDAGGHAVSIRADISAFEEAESALAKAVDAFGGVDGLVLNVGIVAGSGIEATSVEDWDRVFAVNARGHFVGLKAASPYLVDGGSVVFVSSIAAGRAFSEIPAYDASKAAVEGLCRHAALELSDRSIRANAVRVGVIDSPIGRSASKARPGREAMTIPMGRKGTAEEVANVAAFLLSDLAGYVTAQIVAVDGGLTATR